jgi:hypothetical protein
VLLDNDVEEVCPDTYFVKESVFFGRNDLVELKPGGASILLTNSNKREYADLAARHTMTTAIRDAVLAFQDGLWEIVPLHLLTIFSHAELELIISGLPDIDVADLRHSTVYGSGLSSSDRLVQWFWQIVEELPKQDVALLVQFATGVPATCSLAPLYCWLCIVVSPFEGLLMRMLLHDTHAKAPLWLMLERCVTLLYSLCHVRLTCSGSRGKVSIPMYCNPR